MMRNATRCTWYCILQDIMETWCVCAQLTPLVGNCTLFAASLLRNFSLYRSISPFLLCLIVQTKHTGDNKRWFFFWTSRSSTLDTQWAMKLFPYVHTHTLGHITMSLFCCFCTGQLFLFKLICLTCKIWMQILLL